MESVSLTAKAVVKLKKYDENGVLLCTEEHEVDLTEEEANNLWHLQQQA